MDDARRAHILELIWWGQAPPVCVGYLIASYAGVTWVEPLILAYLAFASIAAMAVSYGAQKKAAEARMAAEE